MCLLFSEEITTICISVKIKEREDTNSELIMYIFHIVLTLNVDEYIGSKKFSIELQVNDGDIFSEKKRGGDRLCIDCN